MGRSKKFSVYNSLCNGPQDFFQGDLHKKNKLDGKMVSMMMKWMDGSDDEGVGTADEKGKLRNRSSPMLSAMRVIMALPSMTIMTIEMQQLTAAMATAYPRKGLQFTSLLMSLTITT